MVRPGITGNYARYVPGVDRRRWVVSGLPATQNAAFNSRCRWHTVRRTNPRPWSQGDDNGLCGLFATVNAVRWLWPELRRKNEEDEEEVAALPRHLVQDRLSPEQFQALYLDGDELPLISQLLRWTVD